jgi:hypothetical protein
MRKVYEGLFFTGAKVGFVSERQVEAGALKGHRLVIVPAASHVSDKVVEGLIRFAREGGQVVLVGQCLEFGRRGWKRKDAVPDASFTRLPAFPDAVRARAELAPRAALLAGERPVTVSTLPGPSPTVEWRCAADGEGGWLLYMLNTGHEAVEVTLQREGRPVGGIDLLTRNRVYSQTRLKSLQVKLIQMRSDPWRLPGS